MPQPGEVISPAPKIKTLRLVPFDDGWPAHDLGELEGWPVHPLTEPRSVDLNVRLADDATFRLIGAVHRGTTEATIIKEYVPKTVVALNVLGDEIVLPERALDDTTLIRTDFPIYSADEAATLFVEPSFLYKPIRIPRKHTSR